MVREANMKAAASEKALKEARMQVNDWVIGWLIDWLIDWLIAKGEWMNGSCENGTKVPVDLTVDLLLHKLIMVIAICVLVGIDIGLGR